ncbi:MAG: T9SS type A sorting domain-containing protein [Lewinellaceae bacterium]|nr:T9SS type A sorting domain-containing protein [Lewinellaceae bacterium]
MAGINAQTTNPPSDTADFPYWWNMMQDPNVPFKATQSAFYTYWANRDINVKGNGYKVFKRWEYINEYRVMPNGKLRPPTYVWDVYHDQIRQQGAADRSLSGNWGLVGPSAYPTNNTGQPTGMGRVNAIAFHPTDANIIYVGSPSGGFWKTTNGGSSWTNLTSNLPTLGVSSIIVHPTNPNIIYIGTGDRDSGDAPGLGVFKSTNGGTTWTQMTNGMDAGSTVHAMVMHPTNHDTLFAGTSTGLYRSVNGGGSWAQALTGNVWKDLKYKPGDPSVLYAAYGGLYYRSNNGGFPGGWTNITLPVTGSRIVLGVSAADPTYLYIVQSSTTFKALLRSTDSGLTFATMSTTPNIMGYACAGDDMSGQGNYDLAVAVDPTNVNTVYVSSINNWKSTDQGATWSIVSHWVGSMYGTNCAASHHADQHVAVWSPLNGRLYLGHDGGISYTADGGSTWTQITNNLEIAQVYKIGQSATNINYTMNGYQDNGSAFRNTFAFTTVRGGDGMECAIDYTDPNYRYLTNPNGNISRSSGGGYSNIAGNGYNGINESGAWVTPYALHKFGPDTMFVGYKNVWRSSNVKASPSSSVAWGKMSTGETVNCIALEQSEANRNILYVVRNMQVKRTDNANDATGSVTWTSCALPGGYTPTDIKTHPTDANIVYATAHFGVYKSTDKGATWTDISGTLPALFTNCLVYDTNSDEGLYVGNETGVWYKDVTLPDWINFSTGLPIVDVRELEIFADADPANSLLFAATYGRGLWMSNLYVTTPLPVEIAYFNAKCDQHRVSLQWATASEFSNNYFTLERSADGLVWRDIGTQTGAGNSNTFIPYQMFDNAPLAGQTYYRLRQTDYDGKQKWSNIITSNCFQEDGLRLRIYPNPSAGAVTITGFDKASFLQVFNSLGALVFQSEIYDETGSIQLDNLERGVYFVELSTGQKVEAKKLVVE